MCTLYVVVCLQCFQAVQRVESLGHVLGLAAQYRSFAQRYNTLHLCMRWRTVMARMTPP